MTAVEGYARRVIDDELDELRTGLAAIALEGPKGVGKTRTALQRARTVHRLDDPGELTAARADPAGVLRGERPVLIDEWQRLPEVWDLVRRAVDDGAPPGSFLLTGSAVPDPPPAHSGAGRIVSLRMRPLSLAERHGPASVGLGDLLTGRRQPLSGATALRAGDYAGEIVASGLPGIRDLPERSRRRQLDGYVDRVVDREVPDETGTAVRDPAALRRWITAYAAATATSASFEKLRDAATGGQDRKPSRNATDAYRTALERLWILDSVPAWLPSGNRLNELGRSPKHHLAEPALAAQVLGLGAETLLAQPLAGALFESLATLSIRVYAQQAEARVGHLRTARGRQEVDLIVERRDARIVAIEVKLARTITDADVKHLRWLRAELGDQVLDCVVLSTGPRAYRRPDGIAVVPLALLGP